MAPQRHNAEMFALREPPPQRLTVAGAEYALVSVFKHDFWAATCLYELGTRNEELGTGDRCDTLAASGSERTAGDGAVTNPSPSWGGGREAAGGGEPQLAIANCQVPIERQYVGETPATQQEAAAYSPRLRVSASPRLSSLGPTPFPRVVVKFGRSQPFWGVPLAWYGHWLAAHEQDIYKTLAGVAGVPRWAGRVSPSACAIEYIDARPLDHFERPPEGFFDRLRPLFDEIHARGVAYGDANKRSNILVTAGGEPWLIDYQISIRRRDNWPWPLRAIIAAVVRYLQGKDIYHLYKHKRRMAPDELRADEQPLSRHGGGMHGLHRILTKPYRAIRRRFLSEQHAKGALQSPTAKLEDHYQPEKETWRGQDGD